MRKFLFLLIGLSCGYIKGAYAIISQRNVDNFSVTFGAPILTSTAETLEKGAWAVGERMEYDRAHPLSDGTLLSSPLAESQKGFFMNFFMASYGLLEGFTIGAFLPVQRSHGLREVGDVQLQAADDISAQLDSKEDFDANNGVELYEDKEAFQPVDKKVPLNGKSEGEKNVLPKVITLGDTSGVGDSTIFGIWRPNQGNKDGSFLTTAFLFGTSLPTGKKTIKTRQGELFTAANQPGTGAWIPFAGIIFSKNLGQLSLNSSFTYSQTTKGTQNTTLGSYFYYDFAATYPIYESQGKMAFKANGILELTGEYLNRDKIQGINDPNSGGNSIYINPGIRVNVGESFSCFLGAGFPIEEKLYGTQVKGQYAIYSGIEISL